VRVLTRATLGRLLLELLFAFCAAAGPAKANRQAMPSAITTLLEVVRDMVTSFDYRRRQRIPFRRPRGPVHELVAEGGPSVQTTLLLL
jgi:hypothetical protein